MKLKSYGYGTFCNTYASTHSYNSLVTKLNLQYQIVNILINFIDNRLVGLRFDMHNANVPYLLEVEKSLSFSRVRV